MKRFFITGTDTGVGKTLTAAIMTAVTKGSYWKPIQTGLADELSDSLRIQELTGLPDRHFFPSAYEFQPSLAPYHAAKLAGIDINISHCEAPLPQTTLIVEGAGGVLVPLTDKTYMIDLMKYLNFPVIIVARGTLGTINHTLMTIKILRQNEVTIQGVVFCGELVPENQKTIEQCGKVRTLFHVPYFLNVDPDQIQQWINDQRENLLKELV